MDAGPLRRHRNKCVMREQQLLRKAAGSRLQLQSLHTKHIEVYMVLSQAEGVI